MSDETAREEYGVNSPVANKTFAFGSDDNKAGGGESTNKEQKIDPKLSALVTQVRPEDEANKNITKKEEKPGCFRACCTCIFGSNGQEQNNKDTQLTPIKPIAPATKDEVPQEQHQDSYELEGLLGPMPPNKRGKKTLVLDLDETLVHSSFTEVHDCTFHVPIEIDGIRHEVYVYKRPFCDEFLLECSKHYEIVIFTASLSQYANPVIDKLDVHNVITARLFRESCVLHNGYRGTAYVKDLSRLGRREKDQIIVDNSPLSYMFHPRNAIGCTSWFGKNQQDTELRDLVPVLKTTLKDCQDVRNILNANTKSLEWLINQARPQVVE